MNTHEYTVLGILDQLFVATERTSNLRTLAIRLDLSITTVEAGVAHLEGKGLVQTQKHGELRLTMSGLAAASALSGARRQRRVA